MLLSALTIDIVVAEDVEEPPRIDEEDPSEFPADEEAEELMMPPFAPEAIAPGFPDAIPLADAAAAAAPPPPPPPPPPVPPPT